jgi:hypothetical protein
MQRGFFLETRAAAGVPYPYNAYIVGFYPVVNVVAEFAQLEFP